MAAPHVSAQSWAIFDTNSMNFIFGKHEKERREVASLTKIMTCCTALKLAQRFKIDINNEVLTISERASKVAGTSADLVKGDKFTVWHLLHGLMLPSGNDAACALAEHFGKLLITNKS